jgi:1-phosphofructokinase
LRPCSIAIFDPSPVLTITVEVAEDRPEIHLHAGGQGFWVARMAARLEANVSLCVPLGGETGEVLRSLLAIDGVALRWTRVAGPNGAYLHDRRSGERVEIAETPSLALHRHELDELYGIALAAGLDADFTMLTGPRNEGVLPAETYERLTRDLKQNGRFVLADLSGQALAAALRGGVDLIKVSDEDLRADGRLQGGEMAAAITAARRLRDEGAANVLISRRDQTAVALLEDRVSAVRGPHFTPLDEHGAGDSMFAGLAVGLGSGLSIEDALRIGVAAGALNVTRRGLGTGDPHEISKVALQVKVEPLTPNAADEPGDQGPAAVTAS